MWLFPCCQVLEMQQSKVEEEEVDPKDADSVFFWRSLNWPGEEQEWARAVAMQLNEALKCEDFKRGWARVGRE